MAGAVWLARWVSGNRFWRENAMELWRRRSVSVVVVAIYVVIALLDSVSWVGAAAGEDDNVAAFLPRSIIDRAFKPESFEEVSYSAPLARLSFYDSQPLRYPGA